MNLIKAIIFDFDGTIANTMPFLTQLAVELIIENYHLSKEEAKRKYIETTGLNFATQLEMIFPNNPNNPNVVNIFESKKLENIFNLPIFPDVISTLEYFKKKRIKTFICSSTNEEILIQYCKLNKIYDLVDRIFGYKVGFEKYAQLNFIIQHFNLKPDEVFLIGDSLKDCDFAKSKGINFIGISRIFKPEDFQKKGCRSISSLSGLIKFFDKKE